VSPRILVGPGKSAQRRRELARTFPAGEEEPPPPTTPLLLAGSLGTTTAMWGPLRAALDGWPTISHEHRGHGMGPLPPGPYSIADLGGDVVTHLDSLRLERVHCCGLSLGGMVGMWLAAHHPERVDRLVLCATSAHLDGEAYAERGRAVREAGTLSGIADSVLARWLTPDYAREHPEVQAALRAQLEHTPVEGYASCCDAIAAMDLRPDLARITAPTLCVAGREDPATPPEQLEAIAAAIDGARLEVLSPAAHLVAVERADAVAALILDHLRSDPEP
jgi:3-oxoadipate enol-lactonase